MNKILKITIFLIMIFAIFAQISITNAKQAEGTDASGGAGRTSSSESFNPEKWEPKKTEEPEIRNRANIILGAIRAIGIIVSVGALIVIGIKTMLGSVEEKSIYKQAMPGYILGAIMVMAITSIPSLIYNVINEIN